MKTRLLSVWLILVAALTFPAFSEDSPATAFRLVFKAYDGNPLKTKDYSKFSFLLDTIDLRQPSEFLDLGQMIPNTKFKLMKFEFKEAYDEKLKENRDVSELTIVNTITGQTVTLPYNKVVDASAADARPAPAK